MDKTELVELRPLKPFVGSYRCKLEEADTIDEALAEDPAGNIIKTKVPKKRFVGLVPVFKRLFPEERAGYASGAPLPERSELSPDGATLMTWPREKTVRVPKDIAESLVERGLAELVTGGRRGRA